MQRAAGHGGEVRWTGREPGHRILLTSYVGGESLETTVNV